MASKAAKHVKHILVTGSHRSGTTWAGTMLAAAPRSKYIHEPFNVKTFNGLFEYWFQFVCKKNEFKYKKLFDRIINYSFPRSIACEKGIVGGLKNVGRNTASFYYGLMKYSFIIKDPIALFSADWLAKRFNMGVLVMIRHPAAFCSSIKLKNWKFNFSNFLEQPLLMEKYLYRYRDEILGFKEEERDTISQAILLWNCIHHTISIYQQEHPEWFFIKHEELSHNPLGEFRKIYQFFGLEFSSRVQSLILDSSGEHNPVEQQTGNELSRNSKKNIFNWCKRLTCEEIGQIKDGTREVSRNFYTEEDWKCS